MDKHRRNIPLCLAAISPALAAGTSSLPLSLGCAASVLAAGCAALLAAALTEKSNVPHLSPFAVIMVSAAVSAGCELIIAALFPLSFTGVLTFPLTGAALFFSACFGTSFKGSLPSGLCFVLISSVLVPLCALARLAFSFLPLSGDISMGFIFAGVITAAVQKFCLPDLHKSPEH